MSTAPGDPSERLSEVLGRYPALAIAVSGGVDSLTLATVAHRVMSTRPLMVHAISAAVPAAATTRVREVAAVQGWEVREIVAGEFEDANYLANPYDRCYHCKSNLYRSMAAITGLPLASGTNLDDLGDYRPGLRAASERHVVHPFVDAVITKDQVRSIARKHGLEYADLPAQPCLASRIETGIPIRVADLGFVDRLESVLKEVVGKSATIRVRMRSGGVHVELGNWPNEDVLAAVEDTARHYCLKHAVRFADVQPYRQGSAFVQAG